MLYNTYSQRYAADGDRIWITGAVMIPLSLGTFIALTLSRQELADMIGTTIETSIRIMSRWGKDDVIRTEKDGFLVVDRAALETVGMS